jgi:predicted AAA+ superfamily ATPase
MGESVSPYFLRTSNGEEIDLIFSFKGSLVAVEIKLTTEPDRSMLKTLKTLGDQIGADRKVLIHFGSDTGLGNSDLEVTSLFGFLESISVGRK